VGERTDYAEPARLFASSCEVLDDFARVLGNFAFEDIRFDPGLGGCLGKVGDGGFVGWFETDKLKVCEISTVRVADYCFSPGSCMLTAMRHIDDAAVSLSALDRPQ